MQNGLVLEALVLLRGVMNTRVKPERSEVGTQTVEIINRNENIKSDIIIKKAINNERQQARLKLKNAVLEERMKNAVLEERLKCLTNKI